MVLWSNGRFSDTIPHKKVHLSQNHSNMFSFVGEDDNKQQNRMTQKRRYKHNLQKANNSKDRTHKPSRNVHLYFDFRFARTAARTSAPVVLVAPEEKLVMDVLRKHTLKTDSWFKYRYILVSCLRGMIHKINPHSQINRVTLGGERVE